MLQMALDRSDTKARLSSLSLSSGSIRPKNAVKVSISWKMKVLLEQGIKAASLWICLQVWSRFRLRLVLAL